jgi:hydrogenase maturation protease
MKRASSTSVAIFGLGNELMSDDGVGVHALRRLREQNLPGIDLWEAGTQSLHAADVASGYDHIVLIDAIKADGPPGTVYRIDHPERDRPIGPVAVHSVDFFAAISLGHNLPAGAVLVGVEPARIAYGTSLSPSVAAALPELCRLVIDAAHAESLHVEHAL